jgi:hypothetical protein
MALATIFAAILALHVQTKIGTALASSVVIGGGGGGVPEPSVMSLCICGAALLMFKRKRGQQSSE